MNVEIKGTVYKYGEVVTNKDGLYPKRELVIFQPNEQNENYPDYINIEVQERVFDNFKDVKKGDQVNVITNFGGRLWTNPEGVEKCFNNCKGWKCEVLNAAQAAKPEPAKTQQAETEEEPLPF
jgi:hypothetical protein